MVIPSYLHTEQKAMQHEGSIYFINRNWTAYAHPDTSEPWYYNESTGSSQYEFPLEEATEAVSPDGVPKGWNTCYCPKRDLVWWWHEATDKATFVHPFFEKLQTFGAPILRRPLCNTKVCEWNFNKLREEYAVQIVENICQHVHSVLKEPSFRDSILYYMEGDPDVVKHVSNLGKIRLQGQSKDKDLGNYVYAVFLITAMELARGSYTKGSPTLRKLHLLLVELQEKWPSLKPKWAATTGSLIRKGDVVEVGLAMARMHADDTVAEDIRHTWQTFVNVVEVFYNGLQDCIKHICKCEDGQFPNSTCLPNPGNLAHLIVYTWSGMRAHEMPTRRLALQHADHEIAKCMVRIGSHNWKNCTRHSVDAMTFRTIGMLDAKSK